MLTTVIECVDLDAEVEFFTSSVGARVHLVTPADDPHTVVVELASARLSLRRSADDRPVSLMLAGEASRDTAAATMQSPGGTVITWAADKTDAEVPPNAASYSAVSGAAGDFGVGRAGMEYRDLLPDRWGGRFIASNIRITEGGDVADWVHFHRIRFQMIFVAAGWVDVVYEDQGEPFRMEAGDCVLQPPEIRHRVLRSSPGLEVIEIGCPAEHDTIADHDIELPTASVHPERDFAGQRFVRHVAASAPVESWVDDRFAARDTGIGSATGGMAGAVVVSPVDGHETALLTHSDEFVMIVGLAGSATLDVSGRDAVTLAPRASVALPAGEVWRWTEASADHAALVVSLHAGAITLV